MRPILLAKVCISKVMQQNVFVERQAIIEETHEVLETLKTYLFSVI